MFQKTLCLIAVFGLLEGHLAICQGLAWVNMLQERAPSRGFSEAMQSTFSGAEPCSLCKALQKERQEQQEKFPLTERESLLKFYTLVDYQILCFAPLEGYYLSRVKTSGFRADLRPEAPPVPPPQV